MTIFINTVGPYRDRIIADLMAICPDPGMTINLVTGQVSFAQTQPWTVGSEWIAELSSMPCRILVRAAPPEFSFASAGGASTIRDALGVCIPTGTRPSITGAEIVYDGTGCNGKGAWVAGINSYSVDNPGYVTLFHELVHAGRMCRGEERYMDASKLEIHPDEEDEVVRIENKFRISKYGLGLRSADAAALGGCNPPPKPPKKAEAKPVYGKYYTLGKCFIASAAYGSPMEPRVDFLRQFRETVLKQTRSGRAFFDEFYGQYYQVSPGIAEFLEADPAVMETMRIAVVEPIVQHLQLAQRFPDAPLGDVPEPWKSFLSETRDALQAWTDPIGLPYVFRDLPAAAAVAELAVVLRHLLRKPELRAAYLDRLSLLSEIPLQFEMQERAALAGVLRDTGRTEAEINRVLGTVEDATS